MTALLISEQDVRGLLTMDMAITAVEEAFRRLAMGDAVNLPRCRARTGQATLHVMAAAAEYLGLLGYKAYLTTSEGARFHVVLYDASSGKIVAIVEADYLGQMRTGAASGLATQHMARFESSEVGVFGSGKQARTQLQAVCAVRRIERAYVYSPSEDRRRRFAEEMSSACQVEVVPVNLPELAAEDRDIVITATTSRIPVFDGRLLAEGTHLNAIGSNFLGKAEIDDEAIRLCDTIVVDNKEQARLEAGDFVAALEQGALNWENVHELAEVVANNRVGRPRAESITLFKSVGLAIEDIAVAAQVYREAQAQGVGRPLPW